MKTMIFAINKGGTGKTSVSVTTAVQLSMMGYKVLLIDADPQGNATQWLHIPKQEYELADYLTRLHEEDFDKRLQPADVIVNTGIEKCATLDIIPTFTTSKLETYRTGIANDQPMAVRNGLLKKIKGYDYVIIDTAPSLTMLEKSCLLAADEYIPVVDYDDFALTGLRKELQEIDRLEEKFGNDPATCDKVIFSKFDKRLALHKVYAEKVVAQMPEKKFYTVPTDANIAKAHTLHLPVQFLPDVRPETTDVFIRLAKDIAGGNENAE